MTPGRTRAPIDWYVPTRSVPGLARPQGGDVGTGGVEPRDDRLGVTEQQGARLGQRDGPRAAGSLDERLADDLLERRDLLADR